MGGKVNVRYAQRGVLSFVLRCVKVVQFSENSSLPSGKFRFAVALTTLDVSCAVKQLCRFGVIACFGIKSERSHKP